MSSEQATLLYRLMEWLDGERVRWFVIVPYKVAEKLKVKLLDHIK